MDEKAPKIIDKYKILRELGRGSFGISYLAYDELLERELIIKVAQSELPNAVGRLEQESRALSGLLHPNIAKIFDFGTTKDGRFYMAIEFAKGKDLESIIKIGGPLKIPEIYNILVQLVRAISYAHSKGIIHRDIKPGNIIVAANGAVKVVDFGLAGKLEVDTGQTVVGEVFGTPRYMSPEQFRGESQSAATDIFSIGIVLYEMAYGYRPYQSTNFASLYSEIVGGNVIFPTNPEVPESLKLLIKRCINPNPTQRISSGEDLIKALEDSFGKPEAVSLAPEKSASSKSIIFSIGFILIAFLIFVWMVLIFPKSQPNSTSQLGINIGLPSKDAVVLVGSIILISLSIYAGLTLGKYLNRAKPEAQKKAESILIGTADRDSLTKSIAIEIDGLFDRLKTFDEKFLAQSIALVMKDYEGAMEIDDRQKALMNAVTILEKLTDRLSPWYVRHEKALAFTVSSVGVISGLATAAATIIKIFSK